MRRLIILLIFSFAFSLNHLVNSDSEYLIEHSTNPIDWYPWSKEAFEKAKKENKLIFLSIGYSTCHWCHVMLKESFTDKEIAKILNKNYVSIKVDKEEHPEIDRFYQNFYKKIYNKSAGWPLTIIMLPNKEVVYIDTYVPKNDIFAKKGLLTLLPYYAKAYKENPKFLEKKALKLKNKKNLIKNQDFKNFINTIIKSFDVEYGGFKGLHKFPEYNKLLTLLDLYLLTKEKKFLVMFNLTLTNMAKSGIYDQIEGGFFRYSVYDDFSIPHFEKMLYTNALMIEIYSLAYKYTKNDLYKKVVNQTIKIFDKYYKSQKFNLYYAANSADSPNEGDYFTFSKEEIFKALKNISNRKEILDYINFEEEGNFEKNKNHIYLKTTNKPKNFEEFLKNLKKIRKTHQFPFIDKKKILSWNAMMANSLFYASIIDKNNLYKAKALLNSIINNFYKNNILYHSFVKNLDKKATLEDYAYLIRSLITAYQFTFDKKYLISAQKFLKKSKKFYKNRWYMSENFIATLDEKSYPSAISVMINNLIDFSLLENNFEIYENVTNQLKRYPFNFEFPYLALAKLKIKFNEYILKGNKVNINYPIYYPFVLYKKTNYNYYQVCTIFACLKRSYNFKEVENFFKNIKINN